MSTQPNPRVTDDWNGHWGAYAVSAQQNPAQAYRRQLIFRQLGLPRSPGPIRLLEIGCGQGDLSREIKDRHPKIELAGLDISATGLEIARSKVPDATFMLCDLTEQAPVPGGYQGWATHAVCSEVLEHMDDPLAALRNVRPWLAPGARLVITVPAGPISAFDRHIGHRRHFTPATLEGLVEAAGFQVNTLYGAGFPFFNLYRLTVVARGRKLIQDAAQDRTLPFTARAAIQAFSWLFRMNAVETRLGWQLVATVSQSDTSTFDDPLSGKSS